MKGDEDEEREDELRAIRRERKRRTHEYNNAWKDPGGRVENDGRARGADEKEEDKREEKEEGNRDDDALELRLFFFLFPLTLTQRVAKKKSRRLERFLPLRSSRCERKYYVFFLFSPTLSFSQHSVGREGSDRGQEEEEARIPSSSILLGKKRKKTAWTFLPSFLRVGGLPSFLFMGWMEVHLTREARELHFVHYDNDHLFFQEGVKRTE